MTTTALPDRTTPALRRGGWGWCGPVVARERGPRYAAGDRADGDGSGGGDGGLGSLGAADVDAVAGALAGLPTDRLARALAGAVGRLEGEDAAAVVTAAARPLAEDAAQRVGRSLVSRWGDAGLLSLAEEAVTALGRRTLSPGAVPDADLHHSWERLHRLERRVVGEKLRRLREIDERGSYLTEGARTAADLLVRHGLTYREAREQVDTAAALAELPKTGEALAAGTIGLGQAAEAAKALAEAKKAAADAARREAEARDQAARDQAARDRAEGDQAEGARDAPEARAAEERAAEERAAAARAAQRDEIDEAVGATAGDVNCRQLRDRLERQAAQRSKDRAADKDRRAHRNRYARKFRDGDGLTLQFHGPAAAAQTIWAMLEALSRNPDADDTRTGEQRRFDALRDVADRYLREGRLPEVAGHPAQVLVITGHDTLHDLPGADPATLDGYGPVSSETARMICCDAQITVLVKTPTASPCVWAAPATNPARNAGR